MKARVCVLLLAVLLLLAGCRAPKGDYFASFQGDFTAVVEGEWQGERLAASFVQKGGERTVTFYAPAELCDTVLFRDAEGALSLAVGELSLPLEGEADASFAVLVDLFPTGGEVRAISQENDNIRIDGASFSLTFAPDGTPLAAANAAANVRVVTWRVGE